MFHYDKMQALNCAARTPNSTIQDTRFMKESNSAPSIPYATRSELFIMAEREGVICAHIMPHAKRHPAIKLK